MKYVGGILVAALVAFLVALVAQVQSTPSGCDNMALIMEPDHVDFNERCIYACSSEGWEFNSAVKPKYDYGKYRIRCCCRYIKDSEEWKEKHKKKKWWGRK